MNQSLKITLSTTATITVKIPNRLGMHARPATIFAEIAGQFEADITVAHGEHDPVDGKSIMQLMMLAATQGTPLVILATGSDSDAAVEELKSLVANGFNE
jgi:phosphotransferase system HPr (HPr) family protein